MVNLAAAWAEVYSEVEPTVSVEVSGGGSGQGIAALINGSCDIANCSRTFEEKEVEALQKQSGKEPVNFVVGYDALSIFVHKDNPLESISLEQLGQIYRDDGNITQWSELEVSVPGAKGEEIIRVSRQNNSGTYHYFREAVVGKNHEFKLGSIDMNGSKDVVELIARTPNAIGYCGMGYATPDVKVLKVKETADSEAVEPSVESVTDKTYPIARPMFMYTAGEPSPIAQQYLDWILSPAAQKIVAETGYVPLALP
jgi:phosphate transport system substrate-binding protein